MAFLTTTCTNPFIEVPRFVEWMMCLPDRWVTGIDIPHTAQLRALGNGQVPPQAAHAWNQLTLS
jgi:hypothetical protein